MDWSADGWQSAFRIELRVQAIGFASRGWPVLPGTVPGEAGWFGRSGIDAVGPKPLHEDWRTRPAIGPDEVPAWWSDRPHSLLVATGTVLDALEVDASLGRRAAAALRSRGVLAPIIAVPDGRWYFLTAPTGSAEPLYSELRSTGMVRSHSTGSWVVLPPTPYLLPSDETTPRRRYHQGVVHWRVKPEVCGWRLPDSEHVQDALWTGNDDHVAALAVAGN